MKKVLTIAGSDCSGGAGIQADIKTMTVHRVYAMSAITALTAQNTTGVYGIHEIRPEFLSQQLDCIFQDIFPDAVKIGMVLNSEIVKVIASKLKQYGVKNVVLDPVMISTSGSKLLSDDTVGAVISSLFPLVDVITPNIPEAEALCEVKIDGAEGMLRAAKELSHMLEGAVLIKGGHLKDSANDLLYWENKEFWLEGERVDSPNTHGTGCTLSSAIACNLALGFDLTESALRAKAYVYDAIKSGLDLGHGNGPLDHFANR